MGLVVPNLGYRFRNLVLATLDVGDEDRERYLKNLGEKVLFYCRPYKPSNFSARRSRSQSLS
jgi:hypothetical protein